MSSRVTAKREPSPAPTRPSSLRQSVPTTRPPQLVNGKADTPSGGRTRSSARSSTHTPSTSASSNNAASNTQGTTGEITFEWALTRAHHKCISCLLALFGSSCCPLTESTRSLRAHNSVRASTPPAPEKVTPSPAVESSSGGSALRKLKTPVRHTPGMGVTVCL